jgi:excisionase family DNA binding protein
MRTSMPNAGRPACYTVHQAAVILGVEPSRISRAIRLHTLRAVRLRGRLVVPASALTALLGTPVYDHKPSGGTP